MSIELDNYNEFVDYHKYLEKELKDLTDIEPKKTPKITLEMLDCLKKHKLPRPITGYGFDYIMEKDFTTYNYQSFNDDTISFDDIKFGKQYTKIIQIEFNDEFISDNVLENIIIGSSPYIYINTLIVTSNIVNNCLVYKNNLYFYSPQRNIFPIIEFSKTTFFIKNIFELSGFDPIIPSPLDPKIARLSYHFSYLDNGKYKIICDLNPRSLDSNIIIPDVKYIIVKFRRVTLYPVTETYITSKFNISVNNKFILKKMFVFNFDSKLINSECSEFQFKYFSDFDEDITEYYKNLFYLCYM